VNTVLKIARRFRADDSGAAMIEYSVVIGIVSAVVITAAILVGNYVSGTWSDVAGDLPQNPAAAAAARPVDR
jgi:pilus assembly protein Flp/PilA